MITKKRFWFIVCPNCSLDDYDDLLIDNKKDAEDAAKFHYCHNCQEDVAGKVKSKIFINIFCNKCGAEFEAGI